MQMKSAFDDLSAVVIDGKPMTKEQFNALRDRESLKIKAIRYTRINGVAKIQIATA